MKLREVLRKAEEELGSAGVDNAAYDARELLKKAFGLDTARLLAELSREIGPESPALLSFGELIKRRAKREPLQYLTGTAGFLGFEFECAPGALIPRADTETLAETVLAGEPETEISLLDVCTGTGCIALSLLKRGGYDSVSASDVSPDALSLARRNADRLLTEAEKQRFSLYRSDLFRDLPQGARFDVVVSNPPYIAEGEIGALMPEVSAYEPRLALSGGEDGLLFYRRLAEECREVLREGGRMYLEAGAGQAEAVREILRENGFSGVSSVRDLAGIERAVKGIFHGGH